MNILRIVRSVYPLQRAHTDNDMEMLLGVANAEPEARKIKRRAFDFLQLKDVAVKAPRALKIVDADQNVMKVRFIHESHRLGDLLAFAPQRYQDNGSKYTLPIDAQPLTS